jgi:putative nucleotidyltransferase with HDIG domain
MENSLGRTGSGRESGYTSFLSLKIVDVPGDAGDGRYCTTDQEKTAISGPAAKPGGGCAQWVRGRRMKVTIEAEKLQIGMYVCELDRPWRETPFLFQGFEIRTHDEIDSLRRYCRQVVVLMRDDQRQVGFSRAPAGNQPDPVPGQYRSLRIEQELFKLNNHPNAQPVYQDRTSMQEEVELVRDTFIHTRLLVQEVLHDAKLGRSLNLSGARQAVTGMAESVLRNPDALMCFALLKRRDEYTALHCLRTSILALAFGRQLGMPRERLEALGLGAMLHDIGTVKVPEEILAKPTELTPEETAIMQQHVKWGVEMLDGARHVSAASIEVVGGHHEHYDGSGYLKGLRGDAISEFSMIGAIVDHYDAITCDRSYRGGISAHSALMKMYESRGTLFRPEPVEKFIQCLGVYPIGSVVELNTGDVGVVAAIDRRKRLKPHVMLVHDASRKPYVEMPITNIATLRTRDHRPGEIERVLEPGAAGIDPVHYLRVAVAF